MKILPEYPRLYRFFEKKEYRDQFLEGVIRFGNLESYRKIEDELRKDEHEGKPRGKYKTDRQMVIKINSETRSVVEKGFKPGEINISGDSLNKFFIVSFCDDQSDLKLLSKRFGKYCLRINNTKKLIDLLNENCRFQWKIGKIGLQKVLYDMNGYIKIDKDSFLPFEYNFAQKRSDFSLEHEWRIFMICGARYKIDGQYAYLDIGNIKDMVTPIDF